MVHLTAVQSAPAVAEARQYRDEKVLIRLAREGDRVAAEELVEMTYTAVFSSLYRMCRDSDLAADLTQDTYRKAWEAFSEFDGRAKFFTWLYRIAYTTFLNHIRRPARLVAIDDTNAAEVVDERKSVEDEAATNQEAARLKEAVLKLPEELRFTVTAHFWGELAVKDIAEVEGITTVAIRKRLDRAYGLLQPLLEDKPNV
jgi:RNA polymerase sigma-70 factor, ECF subfamily